MNKVDKFIKNPKKALWKLTWPMMISMSVQALYNIVDTAYIGRISPEAIAALTFAFPIFYLLIAVSNGIAGGMGSRNTNFS